MELWRRLVTGFTSWNLRGIPKCLGSSRHKSFKYLGTNSNYPTTSWSSSHRHNHRGEGWSQSVLITCRLLYLAHNLGRYLQIPALTLIIHDLRNTKLLGVNFRVTILTTVLGEISVQISTPNLVKDSFPQGTRCRSNIVYTTGTRRPGHKTDCLTWKTPTGPLVREDPFWNVLVLYEHCHSFRPPPPLCQTGKRGKKVPQTILSTTHFKKGRF